MSLSALIEQIKYTTSLDDIVEFNNRLNNYEYIIPSSNKLEVSAEDFMKYYKMLTPKEFEKSHGGVCWDYVAYEASYFNKHFPDIRYKTYFCVTINDKENPTHTFILFDYGRYVYWFESSWKPMHGIYMFKNKTHALDYICNALLTPVQNYRKQYVLTYNPLDKELFGMNAEEYMNYMEERLPDKPRDMNRFPKKPLGVISKELTYDTEEFHEY